MLTVVTATTQAQQFDTLKVACTKTGIDTSFKELTKCDTSFQTITYDSGVWVKKWWGWKYRTKEFTSIDTAINCITTNVPVYTSYAYNAWCDSLIPKVIISITTQYGLWVQDRKLNTDGQIALMKNIGGSVLRYNIALTGFTPADIINIKKISDAGITVDLVVSWNQKQGGLFVRDTASYRLTLRTFLQQVKGLKVFVSCEDEVATDGFFNDDMRYYLAELKVCVDETHKAGIKATNSGDHIYYILSLAKGQSTRGGNEIKIQQLLEGYKNIELDFINLHAGEEYDIVNLRTALNYVQYISGIGVFIMNAHVFKGLDPSVLVPMFDLYRSEEFPYVMAFDGDGTAKAATFHIGGTTTLTAWGIELKNAIK